MRGIAIYDDKVFTATNDARLVALDARTGQTVWETIIGERTEGDFGASSGPIIIKGKVVQGMGNCTRFRKEKCFISAYDAKDGHELWRFNTVATGSEPGADTWGDVSDYFRAGGDTWITGSYDPDLDTTYWGVAQAKPWMAASRGNSPLDRGLYTSSTLALDPSTGKLKWYFQHAPGESLDLDEVYERVLVDVGGEKARVHDRQARNLVEARPRERRVHRPSRDGVPEHLRQDRSRDGPAALSRGSRSRTRRTSGCRAARAPRAATTGRR